VSEVITQKPRINKSFEGSLPTLRGVAKPTAKGRLWAYVRFVFSSDSVG